MNRLSVIDTQTELIDLPAVWHAGPDLPGPQIIGGDGLLTGLVVSVPHGGRSYPAELANSPQLAGFRSLEDIGTDLIAAPLAREGRPVLIAQASRALVDVNRPAEARDPRLTRALKSSAKPQLTGHFERLVRAGYGVIPRLDAFQQPLYADLLASEEVEQRLLCAHLPYHRLLARTLLAARKSGGQAVLLDIHSMPPASNRAKPLPDIVFGDLGGRSCPADFASLASDAASQAGFSHSWNQPYAGGWITSHYSAGKKGVPVLQIEINRALYQAGPSQIDRLATAGLGDFLARLCDASEEWIRARAGRPAARQDGA